MHMGGDGQKSVWKITEKTHDESTAWGVKNSRAGNENGRRKGVKMQQGLSEKNDWGNFLVINGGQVRGEGLEE